jgi:hypothetical protein
MSGGRLRRDRSYSVDHIDLRQREILERFGIELLAEGSGLKLGVMIRKRCVGMSEQFLSRVLSVPGLGYESGG